MRGSRCSRSDLSVTGDTTSKTLQEDIARALEKDLTKLREETAALGKISKKILGSDTTTKLTEIASLQGQLLQVSLRDGLHLMIRSSASCGLALLLLLGFCFPFVFLNHFARLCLLTRTRRLNKLIR